MAVKTINQTLIIRGHVEKRRGFYFTLKEEER